MNVFELAAVLTLDKKDYDKGLSGAEKDFSSFGSKLKSTMGTIAKVGSATLGVISSVGAFTTKKLLDSSSEVAKLGDHIDKQSQKIGISAKAYQEWDFILTHSGASVDSLQSSMKTLSTQAEKNASEFEALGISQEELQNMSPEELFERTVKALQNMEEGTERTAIASKLLGKGATELAPVFNSTSQEIEEMRQQAHDLGKVMSDEAVKSGAAYEDSLYNLQTAIGGIKNQISSDLLPSLVTVMDGLSGLFTGDSSAIEKVSEGIGTLIDKISEAIPQIIDTVDRILPTLIEAVSKNIAPLVKGATKLVTSLVRQLPTIIKPIIKALPEIISEVAKGIAESLPELINGVVDLVTGLVEDLPNILLAITQALPDILSGIFNGLIDNLPNLIEGVAKLIEGLVTKLPEMLTGIVTAVGGLVGRMITAILPFGDEFKTMFEGFDFGGFVGGVFSEVSDIAKGIFDFIGTLMNDPAEALKKAFDGVKDYATKVFESIGTIVDGIFELIKNAQEQDEIKERHDAMSEQISELRAKGWIYEEVESESGGKYWEKKGALPGTEAERIMEINHTGTIRVEGVNNEGELVAVVKQEIANNMKEDLRALGN